MFLDSAKEKLTKAVSQNDVAKSKKRKKQSVDAKPYTDEVLKKRKKKKVIIFFVTAWYAETYHYRQHCAKRNDPVFNLLRPILRFFARQGRHVAPIGVKFGVEEVPPPRQISPQSVQRLGYRSPKTEIFLRFDQNVANRRPAGAYPLRDFHIICWVCTAFQCV